MDQPIARQVSYQDYLTWGDENRYEIIDGNAYLMSPAPRPIHQRLVTALTVALSSRLRGSGCEAFVSPLDVKLSERDVVQPDVLVVCDPGQITDTYIEGPPTLVVEILSPSSLRHDRVRKLRLYARFGVAEYWIVHPEPPMLEVLSLQPDGHYQVAGVYSDKDTLTSPALASVSIELSELFGPAREYPDEVRETAPPAAKQTV